MKKRIRLLMILLTCFAFVLIIKLYTLTTAEAPYYHEKLYQYQKNAWDSSVSVDLVVDEALIHSQKFYRCLFVPLTSLNDSELTELVESLEAFVDTEKTELYQLLKNCAIGQSVIVCDAIGLDKMDVALKTIETFSELKLEVVLLDK